MTRYRIICVGYINLAVSLCESTLFATVLMIDYIIQFENQSHGFIVYPYNRVVSYHDAFCWLCHNDDMNLCNAKSVCVWDRDRDREILL